MLASFRSYLLIRCSTFTSLYLNDMSAFYLGVRSYFEKYKTQRGVCSRFYIVTKYILYIYIYIYIKGTAELRV